MAQLKLFVAQVVEIGEFFKPGRRSNKSNKRRGLSGEVLFKRCGLPMEADARGEGGGADFGSLSFFLPLPRNWEQPSAILQSKQLHFPCPSGRKAPSSQHILHLGRLGDGLDASGPSKASTSFLNMVWSLCLSSTNVFCKYYELIHLGNNNTTKQISSRPSFCHRQIVLYTASSGVFRRSLLKSNEVSAQARGVIIYCQRRLSSLKAIVRKIADD